MKYLIFLRLLHIVSAVFWAGATMYLAGFVAPAVRALGPEGGKFMQQLSKTNRLPLVMNLAGTFTVIGGLLLIYELSSGFQMEWFSSNYGLVLSIGGGLALIAYAIGFTVSLPTITKMNTIGKTIATSGTPPTPEQQQELQRLRNRLFAAVNYIAILLFLTVISMSIARYY